MKKLLLTFLILGSILPSVEAFGVSPEGVPRRPRDHYPEGRPRPRKPRCKEHGKVVVCKMPRPRKKCTRFNPCIPRDYYRPSPPRRIPMPLKYNLPNG